MSSKSPPNGLKVRSTLRQRILGFVCALIVLSLLGSTLSLYRVTEVNRLLDAINGVSVPLGRLFVQMQSDAELYRREVEKNLGASHWKDPRWSSRPLPRWAVEMLESEVSRASTLITSDLEWAPSDTRARWQDWASSVARGFTELSAESSRLQAALEQHDADSATRSYQRWSALMDEWGRLIQSGEADYDRSFRQTFALAQTRMTELRTGLEIILVVVVSLSLLLLWLGERALRPLGELTRLAREITRQGLRKEHKSRLPDIPLNREDEVSQLAREFHHMATALLEREKTVETQRYRVQEQNTLLRRMGELNENVLHSIESILLVTDLHGVITQCNPVAARWLSDGLDESADKFRGQKLLDFPKIRAILDAHPEAREWLQGADSVSSARQLLRPSGARIEGRVYGGHLMPLRTEGGTPSGAVLVLDDVTEELDLQERLRSSEHMAAVGRMSAQVAHEVRNPLHSIGLEAEMASELAAGIGSAALKQSLASILGGVDRLEKITDNYLRLSRLSTGKKQSISLPDLLMSVLATYATVCEAQGVLVDWKCEPGREPRVWGDCDLLEQALGNLMRNALQALENVHGLQPRIEWKMGVTESDRVWIRIHDNGPGIPREIQEKLFNPFVTTRAQGTGLGLAFVKRVIEEHGGTVSLAKAAAVGGACFDLLLPVLEKEKPRERHDVQI
ncbi:MAG: ATP-binding protein [Oligoflexia bacterium]|nr:ATP-binding protein [Oligoflexia bacterium]